MKVVHDLIKIEEKRKNEIQIYLNYELTKTTKTKITTKSIITNEKQEKQTKGP